MIDPAERALLETTVQEALSRAGGAADDALTELGWLEMLDAAPSEAIEIVFGALGRTGATATVLDDVLARALGVAPRADLAVLLPPFTTWARPGQVDGGQLSAAGLTTVRVATASELLVICDAGATTVPANATSATPVHGIDPDAGWHTVHIDGTAASPTALDAAAWDAAVALGRRALAHQVAGACRTMLGFAREHALERVQFDRPIARFQAVRHRLADALVAIEALDGALVAAADEPGPITAALAKAIAGRSARTVAAHCQQVLAGIGFTTDHPFHRFLKRTMAIDGVLGSADAIVVDLGRELVANRRVPTLIEL